MTGLVMLAYMAGLAASVLVAAVNLTSALSHVLAAATAAEATLYKKMDDEALEMAGQMKVKFGVQATINFSLCIGALFLAHRFYSLLT